MGYRIVYGPMPKAAPSGSGRLRVMTAVFGRLFALCVHFLWPQGSRMLREIFLPGTPGVTEQALESMVADIRSGEDFGDAVTAFCQEILDAGLEEAA